MIKFFRQSYVVQYVALALVLVALWVPAFFAGQVPAATTSPVTPLFNWVSGVLDISPYLMLTVAFALMVFESFFFNSILTDNQIVTKVSSMGAFVFLLFMNMTLTQTNFYPFALSLVFLLMLVHTCFSIYQTQNAEFYLLNAGVFLALASMCYFPAILLIVWVAVALVVSHNSSLRLQFIPVIGFLFVYFLYFAIRFLVGDLPEILKGYVAYFKEFSLSVAGFNGKLIALLALMVVSILLPLFSSKNFSFEKTISVRMKITMTVVLLLFGIFMLFLGGNILMHGLVFLALSILAAYELSYVDKTAPANLMLYAFVIFVLLNRYVLKIF